MKMHNMYQLIVINIFLILTVISGVNLQPQINFNATLGSGYYKYVYIGYDVQRTFLVGILLGFIYFLLELSIFLKRKKEGNWFYKKEIITMNLKLKFIISLLGNNYE